MKKKRRKEEKKKRRKERKEDQKNKIYEMRKGERETDLLLLKTCQMLLEGNNEDS